MDCGSISTKTPSAARREFWSACVRITADDLARYPEKQFAEEKMAEFLGVAPSELLLTNGADEAIHLLCQTYLEAGEHAVIVVPTYSMYRDLSSRPLEPKLQACQPAQTSSSLLLRCAHSITERTRFIAVANPNNPTGTLGASKGSIGSGRICTEHAGVGR